MSGNCAGLNSVPPKEPVVSIVTPVFNRAAIVHRAIDSAIAQTYQNWELLLVDDGSADNISEIVKTKYGGEPRISFSGRNRPPKGAATCRNIGAENAKGDYLIFLDSDDWLEPFCLEQRVKVMAANQDLDFAVFLFKFLNQNGKYIPNQFDNGKDPLINFLSNKSYWNIMCPIWKKQFFFELGGFNDKFLRYQDVEIHIRALTHPGVKYRLCSDRHPDTAVIPSAKNDAVEFAIRLYASLHILIPQTSACLVKVKKSKYMKYMKGYLKEWLRYFALTNFDDAMHKRTDEILILFRDNKVISQFKMKVYRTQITTIAFLIKFTLVQKRV